jgi:hypothetical protein
MVAMLLKIRNRGNRGKKYVGDRGKNKNIYSKKGKDPLPFAK